MENRVNDKLKFLNYTRDFIANNYAYGPGIRSNYCLHYVTKGKGYFCVNNKTYTVNAGESFIVYPGLLVKYFPDPNDPWEYVWVDFLGAEANDYLVKTKFSQTNFILPSTDSSPLNIFAKLQNTLDFADETYSNPDLWYCIGEGFLHLIFSYYIANYPCEQEKKTATDLTENIISFIYERLGNTNLSVDMVAKKFSLSTSSLFRIFKTTFGASTIVYITRLRMEKAAELLFSTDYPIKAVALSVGFENSMYFSKVFKNHFGVTPSEYRKTNKNK